MSGINLEELRPYFEREFVEIGAVIEVCTSNQLRFVGGIVPLAGGIAPWRPLIVLRGGTIEIDVCSRMNCRAQVSMYNAVFPFLAAIIFWPLSLFSTFFVPIAALLSLIVVMVVGGAWVHANDWLDKLVERIVAERET